jgi:hypothetical protein
VYLLIFTGKLTDEKSLVEHEIKAMEEMADGACSNL